MKLTGGFHLARHQLISGVRPPTSTDQLMAAPRRVIAITAGLMLAGAALGALCGVVTLAPVIVGAAINARTWNDWSGILLLMATAGAFGGVTGTVLGPILAWTFLRRVPLGRIFRTLVRSLAAR